jgi:hypothetical protein
MRTGKHFSEFIATFALTFVGGGAIIATNGENILVIALAHGLILAVMASAMMQVSGSQFNPAVSIALATRGKQWHCCCLFTQGNDGASVLLCEHAYRRDTWNIQWIRWPRNDKCLASPRP